MGAIKRSRATEAAPTNTPAHSTTYVAKFLKPCPQRQLDGTEGTDKDRETVREALQWIDDHMALYRAMRAKASTETVVNGYASIDGICWWARLEHRVHIDNTHTAILARVMQADNPRLRFTCRTSRLERWLQL